ncbi:hypothetical protein GE061_011956, partial [Apolygus lucorum]
GQYSSNSLGSMMGQQMQMEGPMMTNPMMSSTPDPLMINEVNGLISNGVETPSHPEPSALTPKLKEEEMLSKLDISQSSILSTDSCKKENVSNNSKDPMKLPGFHQTFGNITEIGRFSQHDDYFETRPVPEVVEAPKVAEPVETAPKRKPRGRKRKQPEPREVFQRQPYTSPEPPAPSLDTAFVSRLVFLWCAACYRFIAAQDDSRAFHYASFSGPVSGDVEEISVPRSVYPYPYKSNYEQENDMTVDYVAKPDYSFIYGVEDPEFGKSHKHQETREGDVVKGEYSVLEPDGSVRRVVYTSDAEHGFRATVTRTPAKQGWSLPPQPHFSLVDHQEPDHVDEHEHTSDDVSTFPYENHDDYPSPGLSDEVHRNPPVSRPHVYRYRY